MIKISTQIPGPKSANILRQLQKKNGGWGVPHPFVHSGKGIGAYFRDIDGNTFLDFASQVASNPLGYNHPDLLDVIEEYSNNHPIKYAGQDFTVREHLDMIESILSTAPKRLNAAFLVNSGAEAVENVTKICLRNRKKTKVSISMEHAFHGRTLGALSLTNSKRVHKEGYPRFPTLRLPYNNYAGDVLHRILEEELSAEEIGFIILECVQGEGGYHLAPRKMVRDLRRITRKNSIPLICDEVQAGVGRTGKWWAFEHYGITPDAFSSAKALQVGAAVANKKLFPSEPGAISSTWGGGHLLDMAIGIRTIELIKKEKLLARNTRMGTYLLKGLQDIQSISGQRGLGLMTAFDLPSPEIRDNVVIECMKRGLVALGCGERSIRMIPPFVIDRDDIDIAMNVLSEATRTVFKKGFKHTGRICEFMGCADIRG